MALAVTVIGRPVLQSCVGEEELWIRGDDGVDLPADDESLGPSGRYNNIHNNNHNIVLFYGGGFFFANEFANNSYEF